MFTFIASALFAVAGWLAIVALVNALVRAVVRKEAADLKGPTANLNLALLLVIVGLALIHFI